MLNEMTIEIEAFDLSKSRTEPSPEMVPITFWVTKQTKEKYDKVQALSKASERPFSKHVSTVISKAVDAVKLDD